MDCDQCLLALAKGRGTRKGFGYDDDELAGVDNRLEAAAAQLIEERNLVRELQTRLESEAFLPMFAIDDLQRIEAATQFLEDEKFRQLYERASVKRRDAEKAYWQSFREAMAKAHRRVGEGPSTPKTVGMRLELPTDEAEPRLGG